MKQIQDFFCQNCVPGMSIIKAILVSNLKQSGFLILRLSQQRVIFSLDPNPRCNRPLCTCEMDTFWIPLLRTKSSLCWTYYDSKPSRQKLCLLTHTFIHRLFTKIWDVFFCTYCNYCQLVLGNSYIQRYLVCGCLSFSVPLLWAVPLATEESLDIHRQ